jgi:hypothetical protein
MEAREHDFLVPNWIRARHTAVGQLSATPLYTEHLRNGQIVEMTLKGTG